jgi:hypothetical protein
MRRIRGGGTWRVALALVVAGAASATVNAAATTAQVPVAWQHRHARFTYVGMTTLYECDALESQVKRIITYFGARKDMKVTASCSQPLLPTRIANIDADFYSPVLADGTNPDTTTGSWAPIGLESGHPNFIDAGDCDLIEDMKELVTGSFTLRGLDYSTSCFPNQLTLHDFGVKGEVLKVTAATRG